MYICLVTGYWVDSALEIVKVPLISKYLYIVNLVLYTGSLVD